MRHLNPLGLLVISESIRLVVAAESPVHDPRVGYWIEEKISASYPQAQGLQLSIEELGEGKSRYTMGANHTPANLQVVELRCDGSKAPFHSGTGQPAGKQAWCRPLGPRSMETTTSPGNLAGAATTVLIETVSADGTHLTGTWISKDSSGKVLGEGTRHFLKRAD